MECGGCNLALIANKSTGPDAKNHVGECENKLVLDPATRTRAIAFAGPIARLRAGQRIPVQQLIKD